MRWLDMPEEGIEPTPESPAQLFGNMTPEEFAARGENPEPLPETVLETSKNDSQNIFLT